MFGVNFAVLSVTELGTVGTHGPTVAKSARAVTSWCIPITRGHWTSLTQVLVDCISVYTDDDVCTDDDDYDSGKPHRSDLCEKCKKLGYNCRGGRGRRRY